MILVSIKAKLWIDLSFVINQLLSDEATIYIGTFLANRKAAHN